MGDYITIALSLGAAFASGLTVGIARYKSLWLDACGDIGKLCAERDMWRHEANIFARELQTLRTKVPLRDPKTNRFVKRKVA
jgi:hypothetical protein